MLKYTYTLIRCQYPYRNRSIPQRPHEMHPPIPDPSVGDWSVFLEEASVKKMGTEGAVIIGNVYYFMESDPLAR